MNTNLSVISSNLSIISSAAASLQLELDAKDATIADLQAKANTKTWHDLERSAWLLAPGALANTGSTGSLADGFQTLPDTNCGNFTLRPHGPYADRYWYRELGADPFKSRYRYEASFLFGSSADSSAVQAIEMDIQQVIGGIVFNPALQLDFAENLVRIWNRSIKPQGAWESIDKPCPRWDFGKWNTVSFDAHRTLNTVTYDVVTINGMATALFHAPFQAPNLGNPDMQNIGFQLDGNKNGTAFKVFVDAMNFTVS